MVYKQRSINFVEMLIVAVLLLFTQIGFSQLKKESELYKTIMEKDSLLFNIGFNTCDVNQFENLLSEKFEFYHDIDGTADKKEFLTKLRTGLCGYLDTYKSRRELLISSTEIYPLFKDGVLYAVVQTGIHRFYETKIGKAEVLASTAKFTHLWLLENQSWKLFRSLSYDHSTPEKPIDETLLFKDKTETERWLKQKHIPALGIGVIKNGKIEQLSVFGELEKGIAAPKNTIWNVASMTKPITAVVALKLIDAGKWSLDEPIFHYYTDPDIANDPRAKKITTRILLSHQTGFPNWRGSSKDGKLSFLFEPGTKYQYSGEEYEYLRKALEQKFDKSLEQLASELIFQPLGMNDTQFFWTKKTDEARFAKWHNEKGELYETEKNTKANAADNLLTTVEDYSKFIVYVLNGAGLSKKMYTEMIANQVRVNDSKYFGLGWAVDENINEAHDFAFGHGGSDIGVNTIAFLLPKTKQGLLLFTNCDNGTDIFADLLLKYLGKEGKGILDVEMK